MNMPIAIPRNYRPHPGAPIEHPILVSDAEKKLLAALTDGKLDMTEFGIPSAFMEASGSGNVHDAHPGQSGTSNTSSHTSGTSQSQSGAHGTSTSPSGGADHTQGSDSRDGGMRGAVGANAPHTAPGGQGTVSRDGGMRAPAGANAPAGLGGQPAGGLVDRPAGGPPTRTALGANNVAAPDAMNQAIRDALTSNEKAQYVTGADASVPIGRNAELHVLKDVMDNAVGMERNPYTETDTALGKTARSLSGETINGVGAAEVANVMVNRARNPNLYNPNDALNPRQFESLKESDPKIAARMSADVPGTLNFDRAVNNATTGLSNPDTINPEARNATDFQAKDLAEAKQHYGVEVGGNIFGQHYTKPTVMSSLGIDDGQRMSSMPIGAPTSVGRPTQVASISPASFNNDEMRNDRVTSSPPTQTAQAGDSWFGNLGKAIGSGLTTANDKLKEANTAIDANGGAASVTTKGKLAQAFGFSLGADGHMHWSPGDNSKYSVGPGGQGQPGKKSQPTEAMPMAENATKAALLSELETTTDPNRYAEIIRLLNTKYDPDTIRYGLQMRAA